MDRELERFKSDINLADFATACGYRIDAKESSKACYVMRHGDGDKIIIVTDATDDHWVFFSARTQAGGSIIDFVMHRQGVNLGHARRALRTYTGGDYSFPTAPAQPFAKPPPIPRDRAAIIAQWHRFTPYRSGYLEARGLSAATITAFAERIRTDERGNTVFRHDDLSGLSGWEVKNRGFTGYAKGGKKALFACRVGTASAANPPRLVLAESALDAMSYHQHDPAPALVLSFAGGLSPEQETLLRHVLTKHPTAEIVTATDADEQGEAFAAMIHAHRPDARRARPPKGKDWNDALRL